MTTAEDKEEEKYLCFLEASVPTGLEVGASEECTEILGRPAQFSRGRISFQLHHFNDLLKVANLRSVDNLWVVVGKLPDFCKDESSVLDRLKRLPHEDAALDWDVALRVWQHYQTLERSLEVSESSPDPQFPSSLPSSNVTPLTFRVTCTRGGRKHCFSSMEAAAHLGGGVAERFGWKVEMKGADLEVILKVLDDEVMVGMALNKESKFKRNITHFGPTTLRPNIAYGLLRMADIQPGDIVVDPLCGGGSISIEGSLAWTSSYHVAGDIHDLAPSRTRANLQALQEKALNLKVDVLQWDVCHLPLKSHSVDVVVTDLPFGKKCGSWQANWILYPRVLKELGRVCRPSSARAILLTHDNKALSKALQKSLLWKRVKTHWINVGGLTAAVYVLTRSSMK